jgi:hypothetical protein
MSYSGEIHRCIDHVELREKLSLDYEIKKEAYRSEHSASGEIRCILNPDTELVRSRVYPPSNPIQAALRSGADEGDTFGDGFPGTDLLVGVRMFPPMTYRDEQMQEGKQKVEFSVDGIPENGTVVLDGDWHIDDARRSLSEDEQKVVTHEYEISQFPSDQLPIVIKGHLHRDAREYLENKYSTPQEREQIEDQFKSWESLLQRQEGRAILGIEIKYRKGNTDRNNSEAAPERDIGASDGKLIIENFRLEMESTAPNITFIPTEDSTYNPEQQRVEWRRQKALPGDSIEYEVYGEMQELLDLEQLSATARGVIVEKEEKQIITLTGTEIESIYDRTGRDLTDEGVMIPAHGVIITGDIEIDPMALRTEDRKVMDATVTLNESPFDAFERLQDVCERAGMTIKDITEPDREEPVSNREGVFEITKGDSSDGDDIPGELEVKREYGDEGVVYANMVVYGRWTAMKRDRELSQSPGRSESTEDSIVRADQGAIEDRGKTTIDITARSRDGGLNSQLIRTIREGLGGMAE